MSQASPSNIDPHARIKELEAALAAVQRERDLLRASHERLRLELEMLKRRIFVAKAERVDTRQLELEFAEKLRALNEVAGTLKLEGEQAAGDSEHEPKSKPPRKKPTGRRDLSEAALEEERVELKDPLFEQLVKDGKAEAIGFEVSYKLCYKRGGMRRLVVARAKYRAIGKDGEAEIETTPMPPELLPRSLATPSAISRIAIDKHCDGLPLYRVEDRFVRDGYDLDRSIMSRWLEDSGATAGATVVAAMRAEAMKTAFCIATDATGVLVQPERRPDGARQACRRGHYFVLIADRDHIFFEYTPKETSAVVAEMFSGFTGYIQADAKSVYDVLFTKPKNRPPDDDEERPREIGCFSHCRRRFWEAAVQKNVVGREGLARIGRIFEVDASFAGKPYEEIKRLRDAHLRPHLDSFFAWANEQYILVKDQRGTLRSALGYAVRQQHALCRVLDDGRLVLDNNRSERAVKVVALGRKAWLFVGSDDHGTAAGHLMTLIASARLHGLGPELYLRNLFRVLPHWPRERYIELAPKYWAATAARLDAAELVAEIGPLTIPDAPNSAAEKQSPR
jgi:transposase